MLHKWIHLGYYLISVLSGLVIPADQVIARYITGRLLSMVCAPYPGLVTMANTFSTLSQKSLTWVSTPVLSANHNSSLAPSEAKRPI